MIVSQVNCKMLFRTLLVSVAMVGVANVQASAPANIIYIVGDGMGAPYASAYRYFRHNGQPLPVVTTLFDEMLVGTAQTYPHDDTYVTDSAAAATALATGTKTYNGAIGVDKAEAPVETLLERAKALGRTTAMVVTSSVTHATPASFAAHVKSRNDAERIADQYLDQRVNQQLKVDLLLGGGRQYFTRDDRNLLKDFKRAGYSIETNFNRLDKFKQLPALGLFAEDGLPHALGSEEPLRLTKMVSKALSLVQEKPFFMLVEASQIDWCGHANDIACAMAEMHDLHETLVVVRDFIKRNPNTLVVMTADHNTGGLTLGANNEYVWRTPLIHQVKLTAQPLAEALIKAGDRWPSVWQANTSIVLDESSMSRIAELLGKSDIDAKALRGQVAETALDFINRATATGWTSHGHTGEDVLLFAAGKGAERFRGNLNNTHIADVLFDVLNANEAK